MKRRTEAKLALLRPHEIVERLKQAPVVYVPFGPLEWHGPHMPYGTDPLNAVHAALAACARTGGVVWPTQFWGTERERRPEQLASLGFLTDKYVVGMDFPKNLIPSMYCPEEVFAIIVREILRETIALGARLTVLVNGHGGENHIRVLERLAAEFNATMPLAVHVRMAAPREMLEGGSGGHAAREETGLIMHLHPRSVDMRQLPPKSRRLKYTDFAVVDGPGFDGKAKGSGYLSREEDPRFTASAAAGRTLADATVRELAAEVRALLKSLGPVRRKATAPRRKRPAR